MKARTKDTLAVTVFSASMGIMLGVVGHSYSTWQFWAILAPAHLSLFLCRMTYAAVIKEGTKSEG